MRTPLPLARATETPRRTAIALSFTAQGFGWAWGILALAALALGLAWRLSGGPPDLLLLLEVLSCMLYLSAILLVPGYRRTLGAQSRYTVAAGARFQQGAHCAWEFAWRSWLLAMAPAGVLVAYRGTALAAQVTYNNTVELSLSQAGFILFCLLFIGSTLVAGSTVALLWLRRMLGSNYGLLLWLALGAGLHGQLLGVALSPAWRASLGSYGAWVLQQIHQWEASPIFTQDFYEALGMHLARLVLIWAGVMVALLVLQPMSAVRRERLSPLWLAGCFSLCASAVHSAAGALVLSAGYAPGGPGPVLGGFNTGLVALWLPLLILGFAGPLPGRYRWWEYCWPAAAGLGWLALSQAHVIADQTSQTELILVAGLAMLLAYAGVLVILGVNRLAAGSPLARSIALGVLALLLLLPQGAGNLPVALELLDVLAAGWADPLRRPEALSLCAALLGIIALAWPWPRLHSLPRPPAPQPAD